MVGIAAGCSCALYRIPSPIANAVHNEVKKKHLPWAVEVVNDPGIHLLREHIGGYPDHL